MGRPDPQVCFPPGVGSVLTNVGVVQDLHDSDLSEELRHRNTAGR